jgi:23S rRNA (guanine2445-N2)-methyltransferase / 23S rRNA (guanine2069-N7)-methyltransferase
MPTLHDIIAACAFGLESVVVRELADLGYDAKPISTGRVLFQGDDAAIARCNLWLRAADRVLVRIGHFPAPDFDALFEGIKALPVEEWIGPHAAFPVNGRSVKSQLSSVPAVQRATKRALVDRLMLAHRVSTLPETGPTVTLEIALLDNTASLTIDTSGVGLHKRGYRPLVGEASLKETLAAGLVLLSAWRPERPLVDPFCGTGTIAIEAAMIGRRIAPGLHRTFDAQQWSRIPARVWEEAAEEARAATTPPMPFAIHGSDIDGRALSLARRGAQAAGVERDIHFAQRPVESLSSSIEYGCIITNPPYGVRMGEGDEIDRLYRALPLVFRRLPTWSFHVLTGRLDLEELMGQSASRRRKLYNAQIECTYFTFLGPKPPSMRRGHDEQALSEQAQGEHPAGEQASGEPPLDKQASGDRPQSTAQPNALKQTPPHTAQDFPRAAVDPVSPIDEPAFESQGTTADSPYDRTPRRPSAFNPDAPAFGGLRERDERELADFASCLAKNARHLRRWPSRGITCYRVYDRDQVDVPLIIDRYEDYVHVAQYEREHSRTYAQQADWIDAARAIIARALDTPPEKVFIKDKPRQRGLTQHERIDERGVTIAAHEGGLKFEVNLSDYIDTGLFLDHRNTRAMVRDAARGTRMLNLFCYTGSFSVYAAAGGAQHTTSVDLSNTYLDWAQRNFVLNNLWSASHRLVRADVLDFLANHPRSERYDLAVVDPPTFSNSKSTEEDWEVGQRHTELFEYLLPLMSPGGVIYFSNNYRRFKLDEAALAASGATQCMEISKRTVPDDFRNKRIHRCWRITAG